MTLQEIADKIAQKLNEKNMSQLKLKIKFKIGESNDTLDNS